MKGVNILEDKDFKTILEILANRITDSKGIGLFIHTNHSFENWIVVELCGILDNRKEDDLKIEVKYEYNDQSKNELKEKSHDIIWNGYAMEVKIIGDDNNRKPDIYYNDSCVKSDIKKLLDSPKAEKLKKIIIIIDRKDSTEVDILKDYEELAMKFEKVHFKSNYMNYINEQYEGTILFSIFESKKS